MFSVIVPVYNGEKFIERAISCVMAQSFTDWELVIVNDGSTDRTAEILHAYQGNEKIRIITQENGGVSAARNTGIRAASRPYIAFLDCDDIWNPDHLETLSHMIEKYPDAGLYATLGRVQSADGTVLEHSAFFEGKGDDEGLLYLTNFFAAYDSDKRAKTYNTTCACAKKTALLKAGGFREGCKIGEDLALFLQISAYDPVVLSPHVTTLYEKGNSVATKDVSFDPDWFFFEEAKNLLEDGTIPEEAKESIKSVMRWFTMRRARHYCINGQKEKARRAYREIGKSAALRKDKWITCVLLWLPTKFVQKIFAARWRKQG